MKTDVDFGEDLDKMEAKQRKALLSARDSIRGALAALAPFQAHAGRYRQGLAVGVGEQREVLHEVAAALESLSTLHLSDPESTPPIAENEVSESVDEDQLARVKAAREEQAA